MNQEMKTEIERIVDNKILIFKNSLKDNNQ